MSNIYFYWCGKNSDCTICKFSKLQECSGLNNPEEPFGEI